MASTFSAEEVSSAAELDDADVVAAWQEAADRLVRAGAVLRLPDSAEEPLLVGELRWPSANRVMYFVAFGEGLADTHALEFDAVQAEGEDLCFLGAGRMVGWMQAIEGAAVTDPDDYRIAWELWQQVRPMKRDCIERSFAARLRESGALPS